jgi:tetratricopeptide (TPR) repeat protein
MNKSKPFVIEHIPSKGDLAFQVACSADSANSLSNLKSPYESILPNRSNSNLMRELRWYLEDFLDYPFDPDTDHADSVLTELQKWGQQTYLSLFEEQDRRLLKSAFESGNLDIEIQSSDPAILGWPWEVMFDQAIGCVGQGGRLVRRLACLSKNGDSNQYSLSPDRISILLVTSRPYENDIGYRSVSHPLVKTIQQGQLPIDLTILRPPTFDSLRAHLESQSSQYHVVHFDGHGEFNVDLTGKSEGTLILETADGGSDRVSAATLAKLFSGHRVPLVVLNACRSAASGEKTEDPFSSIAGAMIQAGIGNVVAMRYSLYASAAKIFVPEFYRSLVEDGDIGFAVQSGKLALLENPNRTCLRGSFPLEDWLVPIFYQQTKTKFDLNPEIDSKKDSIKESELEAKTILGQPPNHFWNGTFKGRDRAIRKLERCLQRRPSVFLVGGMGGIGKTTLAMDFARWLTITNGLSDPATFHEGSVYWFDFRKILSAEQVINQLGVSRCGISFTAHSTREKLEKLRPVFQTQRHLIVWDNFEVVYGAATSKNASLGEDDQELLHRLISIAAGGKTKFLITSRSRENWLASHERIKIPLIGFQGEELWEYTNSVLEDLSVSPDRMGGELESLLKSLDGHPLAIRIVLSKLKSLTLDQVAAEFAERSDFLGLLGDDDSDDHAMRQLLEQSLDWIHGKYSLLVRLLALHEQVVDSHLLLGMARSLDSTLTLQFVEQCLTELCDTGLLTELPNSVFQIHPLATRFLSEKIITEEKEKLTLAFVNIFAVLAEKLATASRTTIKTANSLYEANFRRALLIAKKLDLKGHSATLLQSIGIYLKEIRAYSAATSHYEELADLCRSMSNTKGESSALHQLGMIAQSTRKFDSAEELYGEARKLSAADNNKDGVWKSTYQLARLAQIRGDFKTSKKRYMESLALADGEEGQDSAHIFHQLGSLALDSGDFAKADDWLEKARVIKEKSPNKVSLAKTQLQLGLVYENTRQFEKALQFYKLSLANKENDADESELATSCHQLGGIYYRLGKFKKSEQWLSKAREISEGIGDHVGAADIYQNLGAIGDEYHNDKGIAEKWYRKALNVFESTGQWDSAGKTYYQLGRLFRRNELYDDAEMWFRKSIATKVQLNDELGLIRSHHELGIVQLLKKRFDDAEDSLQTAHRLAKQLKNRPITDRMAGLILAQLGSLEKERGAFEIAAAYCVEAAKLLKESNSAGSILQIYLDFHESLHSTDQQTRDRFLQAWASAELPEFGKEKTDDSKVE